VALVKRLPKSSASFRLTVRSHELDAYAHVNNAVYQQWFEEGREELLRAGGRSYEWYPANLQLHLVVVRTEIDFRLPAVRQTTCDIHTRLARIGDRSVVFRQAAVRDDGRILAEARTVMVFARHGAAVAVPDDFHSSFAVAPEGDEAFIETDPKSAS
jgi:YbgC/YbaW family acyl-CoA thioester hydrolase